MNVAGFTFGFRVLGDCRQPRRLVDAGAALAAHCAADPRCELRHESYLSAFQFAADFREHLVATGSTAKFDGPCWSSFLWFDLDSDGADGIETALLGARRLATLIADGCGIAEPDVLAFYSGSKGFHLGVPTSTWTPEPGANFHRIARACAEKLAADAGVKIDTGVYDKVRCWRAPNSRHPKTGLHKRRLSFDELMHLSTARILELARTPAAFELPEPTYRSETMAQCWRAATAAVEAQATTTAERRRQLAENGGPLRLNRSTLALIRGENVAVGERHAALFSAAANVAEFGASLRLATALLTDAGLDCGLPPSEVARQIECGWNHARDNAAERQLVELFDAVRVDDAPAGSRCHTDGKRGAA